MVRARHPQVAEDIIDGIQGRVSDCLSVVEDCAHHMYKIGVEIPTWQALAEVRPVTGLEEEREPSEVASVAEARISNAAFPPSGAHCVATGHSSGQSDGQITEWSLSSVLFTAMEVTR